MAKNKPKQTQSVGRIPTVLEPVKKSLSVEFVIPDNPPSSIYANHLVVQSDGRAMYLSFFLTQPPFLLGDSDDVKRQIEELQTLKAHMVAQVIVPQERMGAFLKVLNETHAARIESQPSADSSSQVKGT